MTNWVFTDNCIAKYRIIDLEHGSYCWCKEHIYGHYLALDRETYMADAIRKTCYNEMYIQDHFQLQNNWYFLKKHKPALVSLGSTLDESMH